MAIVFPITHGISGGTARVGHITSPMADWHAHTHVSHDIMTSAQAEFATLLSLQMAHSINTFSQAGFLLELHLYFSLMNGHGAVPPSESQCPCESQQRRWKLI